jgi:hypothetical protein
LAGGGAADDVAGAGGASAACAGSGAADEGGSFATSAGASFAGTRSTVTVSPPVTRWRGIATADSIITWMTADNTIQVGNSRLARVK